LGYVAVTRAKTHLLCTTSRWRDGSKPVEPSEIYEVVSAMVSQRLGRGGCLLSDAPAPADGAENPQLAEPESLQWPRDPLGAKRLAFDEAVKKVKSSLPHSLVTADAESGEEGVTSWTRDAQALINEIHQAKSSREVILPSRLSVSALVALRDNPAELALSIRRPMPRPQDEYSRRGTVFHTWVESYFGQGTLFDEDDLDPIDALEEDQTLEALKQAWLKSKWSIKTPHAVEVPFETVIGGVLVRGRIDAVYKMEDTYEVVDWKTGSKKLGESAAIQLAMYRIAWAKLAKTSVENVSAAFHYVPTGITDRPADLLSEEELVALIEKY
jgi:DNA helicase-2/ATP-dependent DNA helicase PcrA